MPGPNGADASPQPRRDRNPDQDAQAEQGLAASRDRLEDLAVSLGQHDEDPEVNKIDNRQRYWLYEHLRRLSIEANNLLEKFEEDLGPPVIITNISLQYIEPLKEIYRDLRKYYWRPGCLMERFVVSQVDEALLETTRELRKDWASLSSTIEAYVEDRQGHEAQRQPESRLLTGKAFRLDFLAFVRTLSGLVTRNAFKSQHSRLATSLGLAPRRSRGRARNPGRSQNEA